MSHTLNLVIVDDDQDDHDLMRESLWRNEIPFHAESFYNGQQLLDFLQCFGTGELGDSELPDLIILDINMPVMSGIEAVKALQFIPRVKSVPIYLVSTCKNPDIPEAVLKLTKGFYAKPFTDTGYADFIGAIFSRTKQAVDLHKLGTRS